MSYVSGSLHRGDVVDCGAALGVPTPCNRAIMDILSVHSEGRPA